VHHDRGGHRDHREGDQSSNSAERVRRVGALGVLRITPQGYRQIRKRTDVMCGDPYRRYLGGPLPGGWSASDPRPPLPME
jgi:hypothetical protein